MGTPTTLHSADVDGTRLQQTLLDAVRYVYDDNPLLIRESAHERSIIFHVGRRFGTILDEWLDSWQIDLEYNRTNGEELKRVAKRIGRTHDENGDLVLPDLIVHRRGASAEGANLLAVEAKLEGRQGRDRDYGKLDAYRRDLKYRFTVFLELLRETPPRWLWCDAHRRPDDTVFSTPADEPLPMWTS